MLVLLCPPIFYFPGLMGPVGEWEQGLQHKGGREKSPPYFYPTISVPGVWVKPLRLLRSSIKV